MPKIPHSFDDFMKAYLVAALWTSINPDTDEPLDIEFGIDDFNDSHLNKLATEALKFYTENYNDIVKYGVEQAGHDFWLTRNGLGAGFWEGKTPESKRLDKAASAFKPLDIYIGDDSLLYVG